MCYRFSCADFDYDLPQFAAIENNTRDQIRRPPSSSSKSPFESLTDKWDEEDGQVAVAAPPVAPTSHLPLPAEPIEGGGEVELPPIVAEGNLDDPPPEDEGQMPIPDWSSFDLGRCLRALKSERQPTVIKALKRLHMRWWHCSSSRMSSLLKAAGVSKSTLDLIPSVCAACKSCRAWQQPGHRSMTSSRLSTRFNEVVQFDLVFIEDKIVGHLIDEATKWSVVDVLENRETSTILSFITNRWLRTFGPITTIISDQEGAVYSEEGAIWAEKKSIQLRPKPKGAHAAIVERHHQMIRELMHRLLHQARAENLAIDFSDALSEAVFAKNIFLNVGGFSPFQALFGRFPAVLSDLEAAGISSIADGETSLASASRHAVRLRELALSSMIEATAQARMRMAENSNTRLAGELSGLVEGDQVDVYRRPGKKDLSGWRGPAEILSMRRVPEGIIDLRWGGRTMTARVQDVRKHFLMIFLLEEFDQPFLCLTQFLMKMNHGSATLAWVSTPEGWQLSQAAREFPKEYQAVLHVAANDLGIPRCIGGRVGRGAHTLHGLHEVVAAYILFWPASQPGQYQMFKHSATEPVNLKHLFEGSDHTDFCWIQFLSVDVPNSRRVRDLTPHNPQLAVDPGNTDEPMHDPDTEMDTPAWSPVPSSMDTMSDHPYYPPWYPPDMPMPLASNHSTVPSPMSTMQGYPPPPPLPPGLGPRLRREPVESDRSRTTRPIDSGGSSQGRRSPPPTPSPSGNQSRKHPISSQASSSHRPKSIARRDEPEGMSPNKPATPHPQIQVGGSSSSSSKPASSQPLHVTPPTHVPVLPIVDEDTDSDLDDLSTLLAEDEQREHDFYAAKNTQDALAYWKDVKQEDQLFFSGLGNDAEEACIAFLAAQGDESESEYEKGELTAQQVKAMWPAVCVAVRKELLSFSENKAFKVVPAGTTRNCMSSRWVLTWKWDPVNKVNMIKARLTVRGFLDRDSPTLETFAGTASRWSQRLVVAISVQNGWKLLTADVGTAFLRGLTFQELSELTGEKLRRAAFTPPSGYSSFIRELPDCAHYSESAHELEMLKAVYGLKDAPRAWRKRLHIALTELHAEQLRTDANIYIWRTTSGSLTAICSTHVDDLKFGGEPQQIETILAALTRQCGQLKICRDSFEHCGIMHDMQPDGSYFLHQNHYAQRMQLVDMTSVQTHLPKSLVSPTLVAAYMSALGSVAWLIQTRMDIAIYVQALQRAAKAPTVAHMCRLSCVIKWAKRKPIHMCYARIPTAWMKVLVVSDAAFRREDSSGLAMRGSIIGLAADNNGSNQQLGGVCNVIDFFSRRQRRVVRSTFGAETNSLADGLEIGKLIAFTLAELLTPNSTAASLTRMDETGTLPIVLQAVTDCKSLFDALKSDETQVPTESSLIMILLQIKESLRTGTLDSIAWVDTRDMIADALNKGAIARHDIMEFSRTALWKLKHDYAIHREPSRVPIASSSIRP